MLLPLASAARSKLILGLSFRSRTVVSNFPAVATNNFGRFISGSDPGFRKRRESEMKFSPTIAPDKYLERRKVKHFDQFAAKEGKTSKKLPSFIILFFIGILTNSFEV